MIVEVSKRNRLSLEQLKQMDGEPIWVEVIVESCIDGGYALVSVYDEYCMNEKGEFFKFEDYGKTWLAYTYTPAHIDRSKWEPCAVCENETCRTCINAGMVSYRDPCCECDATASGGSYYEPSNFCPHCGRPLTEEAWTELERRLMR